jgi:hypothetical protein
MDACSRRCSLAALLFIEIFLILALSARTFVPFMLYWLSLRPLAPSPFNTLEDQDGPAG